MAQAQGFTHGERYAPVPLSLLGPLLQEIKSISELKCTLRVLGLVHQRRSQRLWVTLAELLADPMLLNGLAGEPGGAQLAIPQGIAQAVERGTLLQLQQRPADPSYTMLLVNDEPGRQAAMRVRTENAIPQSEMLPQGESEQVRPSIFSIYEENIGPLTPLLAEELQEAERSYPWPWIQEAFKKAVSLNHRNWRYIARILERWNTEGKDHGEPWRHTKKSDPKEYLRRY
ncbi:MAG: DnaD domain protein [Dehalococcoidia bacterium]|nr:DnaD domain protein [Dehalococcoidia bacterium]